MPVGHVLVGDSRCDVEHDDTALTLNVITITKTAKLLLSRGVPDVEADRTEVCVEGEGVDLDSESRLGSIRHRAMRRAKNHYSPMYFFSNSPNKLISAYGQDEPESADLSDDVLQRSSGDPVIKRIVVR